MREDKVASFRLGVARKAGFEQRLVARCAVFVELTEPPATRRRILFGVLNQELNVRGGPGTKDWARPKTLLFSSDGTFL